MKLTYNKISNREFYTSSNDIWQRIAKHFYDSKSLMCIQQWKNDQINGLEIEFHYNEVPQMQPGPLWGAY
jgi:antitoxin component YwqK of YwqJK toxin-antitoxin module